MILGIDASPALRLEKTGVEWYTFHLVQALKTIIPPTVRVILYAPQPLSELGESLPSNWEARVLVWPWRRLWTQVRLTRELLAHPPDVFFSPGHVLPRKTAPNTKLVTTIHDLGWWACPEAYSFFARRYLHWGFAQAMARAQILFTPSQATRQDILARYPKINADIAVTPLGIAERYFFITPDTMRAVRARYHLPEKFFIVVGRLEAKKNTDAIIKTFVSLIEARTIGADTALVFVGQKGSGWNDRGWRLTQTQYPNRLFHLGWLTQTDLPALVGAAQALILWSRYEGFGLPAVEAMAAGTPVIAAGHSSLPELIGDAGILVPPDDCGMLGNAMRRIECEPELVNLLTYRGYARAANFRWSTTAEKTWEAMRQIFS